MAEFIESPQSGKVINLDYLENVTLKQIDSNYIVTFIYSNGETLDEIYSDSTTAQNRYEEVVEILTTSGGGSDESAKVHTYSGVTPPNIPETFEDLKVGDFCVCWLNTFLGLYTCTGITSTVTWERVDNIKALASDCKAGTNNERLLTPSVQDSSTFYGLATAAGDSTQASADTTLYPVGTYTDAAKQAIQQMIGILSSEEVEF